MKTWQQIGRQGQKLKICIPIGHTDGFGAFSGLQMNSSCSRAPQAHLDNRSVQIRDGPALNSSMVQACSIKKRTKLLVIADRGLRWLHLEHISDTK